MSAAYAQAALDQECARLARTTSGRNQQLNASAFSLGTLVGADELDRTLAEQRLFDAATANGYVGKDGAAATRASIRSGLSAGERQPRQIPNGSIATPKPVSVVRSSAPELPARTPGETLHTPTDPDAPIIRSGIPGRYHMYRRDGRPVRLKVKKQDGNYVNFYRVRDPNTGMVGWQAKKPRLRRGALHRKHRPLHFASIGRLYFLPRGRKGCRYSCRQWACGVYLRRSQRRTRWVRAVCPGPRNRCAGRQR
jgi:hypothetical protein